MTDSKGKCPLCGKPIDVSPGLKSCVCPTCGQRVLVSAAIAYQNSATGTKVEGEATVIQPAPKTPAQKPTAPAPKPIASNVTPSKQPDWGATVGVFIMCWMTAGFCAGITSLFITSGLGFAGYSTGGLLTFFISIACASGYRSNGKMSGPLVGAVIAGVIIGIIAALIGAKIAH